MSKFVPRGNLSKFFTTLATVRAVELVMGDYPRCEPLGPVPGWLAPVWLALLIMVSFLMVSTWRFYSFKDLNLRNRHPFQVLILICGMGALIWFYSPYVLFILAVSYTLSGIITRFSYSMRRGRAQSSYKEAPEPR